MHIRYYVQLKNKGEHWETYDAFTTYGAALHELKKLTGPDPHKIWRVLESKPVLTELFRTGDDR